MDFNQRLRESTWLNKDSFIQFTEFYVIDMNLRPFMTFSKQIEFCTELPGRSHLYIYRRWGQGQVQKNDFF